MATSSGVIWFDVEASQTDFLPTCLPSFHLDYIFSTFYLTQQHNSTEILEPIRAERGKWHRRNHRVGVSLFNLEVELGAQIGEQGWWNIMRIGEGNEGCDGYAVTESHLAWNDGGWDLRVSG